jgi:hypothetical protein
MVNVRGISDEVTTCEACGKKNLKRTVVLEINEGGPVHYGTDCAAKAICGRKDKKVAHEVEMVARAKSYIKAKLELQKTDPRWTVSIIENKADVYFGCVRFIKTQTRPEGYWTVYNKEFNPEEAI